MRAYTVQVPPELGRFLAVPFARAEVFRIDIYSFYGFSEQTRVSIVNENCLPDYMLQCGTESKSVIVIMGPQVRYYDGRVQFKAHRVSNISLNKPRSTSSQSILPPLE